ncbi:unnamed protein product, partial [Mesorhabditis belari]|uniref:Bromo domain-containing protein n=1 Tax=Mesorhabditis belari TaxID=2138241 RepID=A0AAF3FG89_9BILA
MFFSFQKRCIRREWSTREKLVLFKAYLNHEDWDKRAAEVQKQCGAHRPKHFFLTHPCQVEFNRLFAKPFPGMMPLECGIPYTHKFHVQQYVKYLEKEVLEDEAREEEADLATIRHKIDTLLRIKRGEVDEQEMKELLDTLRAEDAEKDQDEVEFVVGTFMNRLKEVQREHIELPPIPPEWTALTLLPPSSISEQVPRGLETAFRSPSPQKPMQVFSPIRPIKESIQEVLQERNPPKEIIVETQPPAEEEEDEPKEEEQEEKREEEQPMDVHEIVEHEPKIEMGDDRSESGSVASSFAPVSQPTTPLAAPSISTPTPAIDLEVKARRGRPRLNTTSSNISTASSAEPESRSRRPSSKFDETPKADPTPATARRPSLRRPPQLSGLEEFSLQPVALPTPSTPADEENSDGKASARGRDRRSSRNKKDSITSTPASAKAEDEEMETKSLIDTPVEGPIDDMVINEKKRTLAVATEISIYSTKLLPPNPVNKKQNVRRSSRVHQPTSAAREGMSKAHAGCQTSIIEFGPYDEFLIKQDRRGVTKLKRPFVQVFPAEMNESDDESLISVKRRIKEEPQQEKKGDKKSGQQQQKRKIKGKIVTWKQKQPKKEPEDVSGSPSKKKEEKPSKEDLLNAKALLLTYLTQVLATRSASIFRNPVTDREAPDYSKIVKKPTDLTTIKADIEKGKITTLETLKHHLLQMFANAVMFNYTDHEVNTCAKEMAHDTIDMMRRFNDTNLKTRQLHPVSKRLSRAAPAMGEEIFTGTPGGSAPRRENNGRLRFAVPQLGTRRDVRVGLICEDEYPRLIPDINFA